MNSANPGPSRAGSDPASRLLTARRAAWEGFSGSRGELPVRIQFSVSSDCGEQIGHEYSERSGNHVRLGVEASRANRHADAQGLWAAKQGRALGHGFGGDGCAERVVRESCEACCERRGVAGLQETQYIECVLVAGSATYSGTFSDLVDLGTSSAAVPATSIAIDRSTPGSSDAIVMRARSTSTPSSPLPRRAALLPWGPIRAYPNPQSKADCRFQGLLGPAQAR